MSAAAPHGGDAPGACLSTQQTDWVPGPAAVGAQLDRIGALFSAMLRRQAQGKPDAAVMGLLGMLAAETLRGVQPSLRAQREHALHCRTPSSNEPGSQPDEVAGFVTAVTRPVPGRPQFAAGRAQAAQALRTPGVLLIDPDEAVGLAVAALLEPGWPVTCVADAAAARALLARHRFRLVVLEAAVPGGVDLFDTPPTPAMPPLLLLCRRAPDLSHARHASAILLKARTSNRSLQIMLLSMLSADLTTCPMS